jgi:hypothetical protein
MMVTEMAAKIASLSDLRIFNVITPEEAVDWFTQYLIGVAKACGNRGGREIRQRTSDALMAPRRI